MKILLIAHHRLWRAQYRSRAIAERLAERGHKVTLIVTANNERFRFRCYQVNDVEIVESPDLTVGRLRSGWDPVCAVRRIAWLKANADDFDLVHLFETRPATIFPGLWLRHRINAPIVIDWIDWWGRGGIIKINRPLLYRLLLGWVETFFEESRAGIYLASWWQDERHRKSVIHLELGIERPASSALFAPVDWIERRSDARVLLVLSPEGYSIAAVPTRFGAGTDNEVVRVTDIDTDGNLEIWWGDNSRKCEGNNSDLELNVDCSTGVAELGEIRGNVLTFFTASPAVETKPATQLHETMQAAVAGLDLPTYARGRKDRPCNLLLLGSIMKKELDISYRMRFNGGDVIDAEIVANEFPDCKVTTGPPSADNRSYRVSFARIHAELPGFACSYTARDGARQFRELFERIQFGVENHEFRAFTRLKQLEYLQASRQIDDDFFWN